MAVERISRRFWNYVNVPFLCASAVIYGAYLGVFVHTSTSVARNDFIALLVIFTAANFIAIMLKIGKFHDKSVNSFTSPLPLTNSERYYRAFAFAIIFILAGVYFIYLLPFTVAGVYLSPRELAGFRHQDEFFSKILYGKMLYSHTLNPNFPLSQNITYGGALVTVSLLPLLPFASLMDDPASIALASARLVNMLSGLAMVVYLFLWAHYNKKGLLVAVAASLLLATSPQFIRWSLFGNTPEGMTALFASASILLLAQAVNGARFYYYILAAISAGVSYGVKFIGLFPFSLIFLFCIASANSHKTKKEWIKEFFYKSAMLCSSFIAGIAVVSPYQIIEARSKIANFVGALKSYLLDGVSLGIETNYSLLGSWTPFLNTSLLDQILILASVVVGLLVSLLWAIKLFTGKTKIVNTEDYELIAICLTAWSFIVTFLIRSYQSDRTVIIFYPLFVAFFALILGRLAALIKGRMAFRVITSGLMLCFLIWLSSVHLQDILDQWKNKRVSFNLNQGRPAILQTFRSPSYLYGYYGNEVAFAWRTSYLQKWMSKNNIPEEWNIVSNYIGHIIPEGGKLNIKNAMTANEEAVASLKKLQWGCSFNPPLLGNYDIILYDKNGNQAAIEAWRKNYDALVPILKDTVMVYPLLNENSYPGFWRAHTFPPRHGIGEVEMFLRKNNILNQRGVTLVDSIMLKMEANPLAALTASRVGGGAEIIGNRDGINHMEFEINESDNENDLHEIEIIWGDANNYPTDFTLLAKGNPGWETVLKEHDWKPGFLTYPVYFKRFATPIRATHFRLETNAYHGAQHMIIKKLAFYGPIERESIGIDQADKSYTARWRIESGGRHGFLQIKWGGNEWAGRFRWESSKEWEKLRDICYDPCKGTLQFKLTSNGEIYSGAQSGGRKTFAGTISSDGGTGIGVWKTEGMTFGMNKGAEDGDGENLDIKGEINSGGTLGVLGLVWTGTEWTGSIKWGSSKYGEKLKNVCFDPCKGYLSFSRTAENEKYLGDKSKDGISYAGMCKNVKFDHDVPWKASNMRGIAGAIK